MSAPPLDEFLVVHGPGPARPVPAELHHGRELVREALAELAGIPDDALEKPWPWFGEEADVRYGLYRQYEALEEARARVAPLLAGARAEEAPARPMLADATAARWDLHGLLAGLSDELLDRPPGGEEWTLRQTLAHIVSGQRGYSWGTAWWLSRRHAPETDFPRYVPDDVVSGLPDEEAEGVGSLRDIQARLDVALDQGAGVMAGLTNDDLGVRARWSGIAVDVRFRLHRWSSHIREHTVQVEKTLAMVGRTPSEAERVARLIGSAFGRLEAELYMSPAGHAADEAGRAIETTSTQLRELSRGVVEAAGAAQKDRNAT